MSTLTKNALAELMRKQREIAEMKCDIAGIQNDFLFNTDPALFDQEDIAFLLFLHWKARKNNPTIFYDAWHNIILKSVQMPALGKDSEIFVCGFTPPGNIHGKVLSGATLFRSGGKPVLTYNKGNIGLKFPECRYSVFLRKENSDFHSFHGEPIIELYTDPHPKTCNNIGRRKVDLPNPFPAGVLLNAILEGDVATYSSNIIQCRDTYEDFIAAPKVHDFEGQHMAGHLRKFAAKVSEENQAAKAA